MPKSQLFSVLCAAGLTLATLSGCPSSVGLTVDVKTDYAPVEQFARVRTEVQSSRFASPAAIGDATSTTASAADRFLTGVRVAERGTLAAGTYFVRVSLLDAGGTVIASRTTEVRVAGRYALTTILSRSCAAVTCPAAAGDPRATECNGGVCVEPTCSPETPAACPAGCASARDCSSDPRAALPCASPACIDGVCLFGPDVSRCRAGERCSGVDLTCALAPDSGTRDAASGVDASRDAASPDASGTIDAAMADAAVLVCDVDHGNCDGDLGNGCETDLRTSVANCGGCGLRPTETCDGRDNTCEGTVDEGCHVAVHRAIRMSPSIAYRYTTDVALLSTDGFRMDALNVYYISPISGGPGSDGLYECQWTTGGTLHTRSPDCEGHPETGVITQVGRVFNPDFLGDPATLGCTNVFVWSHTNPGFAPSFYHSLSLSDPPLSAPDWMASGETSGPHVFCVWSSPGP